MTGTGHIDHVRVVLVDQPVGVGPDEGLPWAGSPVSEKPRLDVLRPQGFPQQRVVLQVDHSDGQVVGRAPVGVEKLQLFLGWSCHSCELLVRGGRHGLTVGNTLERSTRFSALQGC